MCLTSARWRCSACQTTTWKTRSFLAVKRGCQERSKCPVPCAWVSREPFAPPTILPWGSMNPHRGNPSAFTCRCARATGVRPLYLCHVAGCFHTPLLPALAGVCTSFPWSPGGNKCLLIVPPDDRTFVLEGALSKEECIPTNTRRCSSMCGVAFVLEACGVLERTVSTESVSLPEQRCWQCWGPQGIL